MTSQHGKLDAAKTIVVLTGFMGSGKTSTGEALAELLGWAFVDLDREIETQEGVAIRELFAEKGEADFRAIEHEALRTCVGTCEQSTVIALGGGAMVQSNNSELIQQSGAFTVFLDTPLEDMLQRCGVEDEADPANPRPLAADTQAFRELYERRLPHYRAAQLTIDTAGKSVDQVAKEVADVLRLTL